MYKLTIIVWGLVIGILIGILIGLNITPGPAGAQTPYDQERRLQFLQQQIELLKAAPAGTIKIIELPCP